MFRVASITLVTVLSVATARAAELQNPRSSSRGPTRQGDTVTLESTFPGALLHVASVVIDRPDSPREQVPRVVAAAAHAASNPAVCAIVDALGLRSGERDGPFAQMQELLELSTGEFEFVVPTADPLVVDPLVSGRPSKRTMPSFVCRFRLSTDRAIQLAHDLGAERMTRRHRRVGDYQTHTMLSSAVSPKTPRFEVALIAEDLFVGSGRAPAAVVASAEQTPLERVLTLKSSLSNNSDSSPEDSAKPVVRPSRSLRRHVGRRLPGSLTLSLDWKQLERRLEDRCEHAGPWLERWFGLSSVDRVTVELTAERPGLGRPVVVHTAIWLQRESKRSGGLLRASRKERIRSLAAKLPPTGLGALVVAVDAKRLVDLDSVAFAPSHEASLRHNPDRELVEDGVASTEEEMVVATHSLYMRMHHDSRFATFGIESALAVGIGEKATGSGATEGGATGGSATHQSAVVLAAFDRIAATGVFKRSSVDAVFRIDRPAGSYGTAHAGAIDVADDQILIRMVNVMPN